MGHDPQKNKLAGQDQEAPQVNLNAKSSQSSNLPVADEFEERKNKLADLRAMGIQPYPERFERTHFIAEARAIGEKKTPRAVEEILADASNVGAASNVGGTSAKSNHATFKLCGRIVLMRPHGKLTFAQLQDSSGKLQLAFMQDFVKMQSSQSDSTKNQIGGASSQDASKTPKVLVPPEAYKLLRKIDMGDFIGVTGELFLTKHGELTLLVESYELLAKTLRPLPEKFHGLSDVEIKYRKRYLDMITDPESYQRFLLRTHLITAIRNFLDQHGFIEIETPVLTSTPSGATAKPFITHHNALDSDFYLRIATETYLKRAVVGGFERVYEIAKCFRNEGMDPSHLQEFTMLEFYGSYWNYEDNMNFTEQLVVNVLQKLKGTLKIACRDHEGKEQIVDFTTPWPRLEFVKLIEKDCGINILDHYGDADSLRSATKSKKIIIEKAETMGYGNLCDALYKKVSRPLLIQPAFVIKHPVDTKPLARRNDTDPRLADTFQLLVNSWEIINAYSELVDPVDQRNRLVTQADAKAAGDEEAMPMDEDFLMAMEHGMPPMSGNGIGIDRLMALITNQDNLKDTVMFPLLKPEG